MEHKSYSSSSNSSPFRLPEIKQSIPNRLGDRQSLPKSNGKVIFDPSSSHSIRTLFFLSFNYLCASGLELHTKNEWQICGGISSPLDWEISSSHPVYKGLHKGPAPLSWQANFEVIPSDVGTWVFA
ncbi:hypothetical protein CEXT_398441 [Caerostris extrusa]|uniref:Uncharacterized protein n=1 Tax=Caerostris extrusa TaxID=172846 RepID=A0AAV4RRR5_CAEEX|nr:hypothetical protein CEXT_398441 [Caerostris extrusa]